MGYNMSQVDANFFITKENKEAARLALLGDEHIEFTSKHDSLERVMRDLDWEAACDDDGNVTAIGFAGEKYIDDDYTFRVLAPFVKAGSFIEMSGEDGAMWRWVFDGTQCKEIYPRIIWEE